ncbi:MAG: hypothetical protein AMXMBFR64_58600 [Myxococcales bacterium]
MWRSLPILLWLAACASGASPASAPDVPAAAADVPAVPDALVHDEVNGQTDTRDDATGPYDLDAPSDTTTPDDSLDALDATTPSDVPDVAPAPSDAAADGSDDTPAAPQPVWDLPPWVDQHHITGVPLDGAGESPDLTFTLPSGHHTFLIVVTSGEPAVWHMLAKLVTPQGKPVVKPSGGFDCIPCQNRVVGTHTVATFLFPTTPDLAVKSGKYVLRLQASIPGPAAFDPWHGTVDVAILMAKGDDPPPMAELDLALRFTGSGTLTAETAPSDARLQQALTELAALYATAGVAIGDVTYAAAPQDLQLIETVTGPESDLAQLLSLATAPAGAVDVFFVDQIHVQKEDGASIVLGIAGGIPGPALVPGTVHSGVAVSTLPPFGPVDHLGTVIAHELGHYLGLFHVVEDPAGPYVPDPLADTPDDDLYNVMWWTADGLVEESAKHFTPHQADVIRRNPATRPTP